MTDHLTETVSDRGLRYFPRVATTDGAHRGGWAEVHESSSAEGPALWLTATVGSGASQTVHLSTEAGRQIAEQIVALCDQIDREWAMGGWSP